MAIIVYDITCGAQTTVIDLLANESFGSVRRWFQDIRDARGDDALIVLVGNKSDLEEDRVVPTSDGLELARELNIMFVETSALTEMGINELFDSVISILLGEEFEEDKNQEKTAATQDQAESVPNPKQRYQEGMSYFSFESS